ncbi:hypothetical protein HETIRDRAFT_164121 [Heterobasidion irregulare TC 32-1]|uniref:Uncharacterized protein n=1 Tax=Heterobasidion irregulare (strain TC 32-1) TaxID=747525 RepID=W4JX64_HETIT|nr:uncharacterized protein HETIRDRAFT_164121 [Heterobasidion irregulare TC 32-1]ETW78152.1 hypothetical protein HETIRDRAFT_164121 [Heterobasidion irregulare TC 32-1]
MHAMDSTPNGSVMCTIMFTNSVHNTHAPSRTCLIQRWILDRSLPMLLKCSGSNRC